MNRKSIIFILAALAVMSLSACGKKHTEPEQTSLEVIEPESTASETISDKLDEGTELKVVPEGIYIIDGKQLTESEYAAYQESLQADIELPTDADGNNIPGGYSNSSVITETNASGEITGYSIEESTAGDNSTEESTEAESLSEQQINEMEEQVSDFTYQQAIESTRTSIKYDLAELRGTNPEFANITDEMVDNYTEDELNDLLKKIMKAKGF